MDPYLETQIQKLIVVEEAIKKLSLSLKKRRTQKAKIYSDIYKNMTKKGISKYGKLNINAVKPKPKTTRKKKKDRERDALELFASIGATEPHVLLEKFQETQKNSSTENK